MKNKVSFIHSYFRNSIYRFWIIFTMQKKSLLWNFNEEKYLCYGYVPRNWWQRAESWPLMSSWINTAPCLRVYRISDMLIMEYQGLVVISDPARRRDKRRGGRNGNAAESVESLSKIGKQAWFIGSLTQHGSAFHQLRQMKRTITLIDYSLIVAFFRLKAR